MLNEKQKVHNTDMDQERKVEGPTETVYAQGPEFAAMPLISGITKLKNVVNLLKTAFISSKTEC